MKQLKHFLIIFISISFLFVSCNKEEEEEPVSFGKATVKGHVDALLVDTVGSERDPAPSGTMITVWISTEDLITSSNSTMEYERRYYTAELDGNGDYEVEVDANNEAVTVHVDPDDFEEDQVKSSSSDDDVRTVYKAAEDSVMVRAGQTKILDFNYTP